MSESNTKEIVDTEVGNLPTIPSKFFRKKHKLRLREVRTLYFIRGWSKDEIAEALKVKPITVERDIAFIKQYGRTLSQKDMEYRNDALNFLWELHDNYRERIKYLWNDYKKTENETTKVQILKELREQEKQYFEFLQSLGILPKEAEKYIHGITYISHLKDKETEVKENEKVIADISSTIPSSPTN